jgi:Methyltransferase domain
MNDNGRQPIRLRLSHLKAQFLTMARLRDAGFFVRYDHVGSVPETIPPYPEVEVLFESARPGIERMLQAMAGYLPVFENAVATSGFDWTSTMFSPFDTMAAYTVVRQAAPSRVLEIGSGSSTLALVRAVADAGGTGTVTCIDPAPRRDISGLEVELHQRVLAQDDITLVDDFGEGDVLFIDSSHIMLPGMDVDLQFNRMFPRLAPGVLVHVHDIFLPDNYPQSWRPRWYSEQNALIGWLLSGYFEVIFPTYFATTRMAQRVEQSVGGFAPFRRDGTAGSIWLRRTQSRP